MNKPLIIDVNERPASTLRWIVLSLQHLFAMFGATILVPILTGLDHGVALIASGVGTLIYLTVTKAKVPVYLGSSFAYISAIAIAGETSGFPSAFVGLMLVGLVYLAVALIIYFFGTRWIHELLPPVVVGPVIITIGLSLAPVAVGYAGMGETTDVTALAIAAITFSVVVGIGTFARGFLKIIPFVIAIVVGYAASIIFGEVTLSAVFADVAFLQIPDFRFLGTYDLDFSAALLFLPIAFVTITEHIGDHIVLGEITGKDFIEKPGLHRTLAGDGLATFVSAAMGGPANTTYGENTGVIAMTKVGSTRVIALAAVFAVLLGFLGPVQAFVASIPDPVLGGMTIVLYGLIASNGIKVMVRARVDMSDMRNLIIVSTMLVIGLGGAMIPINEATALTGMSLAAIIGIILNLIIPKTKPNDGVTDNG